jgi:DNA processing protein
MRAASPTATALLALMNLRNVGRRSALRMVDAALKGGYIADRKSFISPDLVRPAPTDHDFAEAWKKAERQLDESAAAGICAFSLHDKEYPSTLRAISDPPAVLFVKGNTDALKTQKTVAIVGTREPTDYGKTVAGTSGDTSAQVGFVVVSGLAHGCDTYAHEGCLIGKGVGIAVMAHGLDKIYPAASRELASRLLEEGGCLVSEYPIHMAPARAAFAERDRIQSGLSEGVLVIETDTIGGTMHTVRFCRDQRRRLACIAHPQKWLTEEKTRGNQKLIADRWAFPVPDNDALLNFLDELAQAALLRSQHDNVQVLQESAQQSWAF